MCASCSSTPKECIDCDACVEVCAIDTPPGTVAILESTLEATPRGPRKPPAETIATDQRVTAPTSRLIPLVRLRFLLSVSEGLAGQAKASRFASAVAASAASALLGGYR
jgi:ferredoxin